MGETVRLKENSYFVAFSFLCGFLFFFFIYIYWYEFSDDFPRGEDFGPRSCGIPHFPSVPTSAHAGRKDLDCVLDCPAAGIFRFEPAGRHYKGNFFPPRLGTGQDNWCERPLLRRSTGEIHRRLDGDRPGGRLPPRRHLQKRRTSARNGSPRLNVMIIRERTATKDQNAGTNGDYERVTATKIREQMSSDDD